MKNKHNSISLPATTNTYTPGIYIQVGTVHLRAAIELLKSQPSESSYR